MNFSDVVIYTSLFISLYFEIFLLITFFENKQNNKEVREKIRKKNLPSATIVVPCWNEESTVAGTIQSLLNLNYPKNKLTLVVVDDGSTDNTLKEASRFKDNHQVKIITKENGGKHTAMNIALEQCNTELVGCLDADSFVDKDALMHSITHFSNPRVAAVTPGMRVHNPKNFLQQMQKAEYILSLLLRKMFAHMNAIFITPGPFSIFRTSAIRTAGPWKHAHGTEDLEMGIRLQNLQFKIENEPQATVLTTAPSTLKTLYKQRVRWTHGFLRNAWDYRDMFFSTKYGNLGVLILPLAIISVVMALLIFSILIYSVITLMVEKVVAFLDIGFAFPHFDLFYLNTTAMSFLIITILFTTFILLILGKNIAKDKNYFGRDALAYFTIYGLVAPLWLTGATIKALARKGANWR